ncbi:MAG: cation-translocating P-type ATPase, partial [Arcobacteraceae bacterium]|nr:cation-translocating P-type ATPase [Arcobacteraceae bacterium]
VGDGINDALALSRADISISMGSGADIAIAISDVVILNNSLKGLEKSFYISKRTYGFIKQNLLISLIYNVITIPIALAGFVIPLVAALSMSLSSLLVVGNSVRIKDKKYE